MAAAAEAEGDIFGGLSARASNPEQQRVAAVLGAVRETIRAQLGDGSAASDSAATAAVSPTAYFAALMTALERTGAAHAKEILYLLSRTLPHVSPSALRSKAGPISAVLFTSLQSPALSKDAGVARSLVSCLGSVCLALESERTAWARPEVVRLHSALLSFAADARPKIRHAAQTAVVDLALAHYSARTYGCAESFAASVAPTLHGSSQRDVTRTLQLVPLLRSVLPLLPLASIAPLCEEVLRLPRAGNPRLSSSAYDILATLMESPRARLSVKFTQQMVAALIKSAPSVDDAAAAAEYVYAVAAAVTRLGSMERIRAGQPPDVSLSFPRITLEGTPADRAAAVAGSVAESLAPSLLPAISAVLAVFASDRVAVQHAAANALAIILTSAIDAGAVANAVTYAAASAPRAGRAPPSSGPSSGAPLLVRVISLLDGLLQYAFQASWPVSLPLLGLVYRMLGAHAAPLMDTVTSGLAAARGEVEAAIEESAAAGGGSDDEEEEEGGRRGGGGAIGDSSDDDSDAGGRTGGGGGRRSRPRRSGHAQKTLDAILQVLAVAVRVYGIAPIVAVLGLGGSGAAPGGLAPDRVWLLPLLRDNGPFSRSTLAFFSSVVVPLIRAEEAAGAKAATGGLLKTARHHRARALQLWALLPALMSAPTDLPSAFNVSLGKLLTGVMGDPKWPELPIVVSRALETVIVRCRAATGLPPLSAVGIGSGSAAAVAAAAALNGPNSGDSEVDALTAVGGGAPRAGGQSKRQRRRGGEEEEEDGEGGSSDEEEDDDDEEEDEEGEEGRSRAPGDDDGATTVFGAGGVSVTAGRDESSDPRHPLLAGAMDLKGGARALPPLSPEEATRNLGVLAAFAKNYIPVLFNVYEASVVLPPTSGASPAGAGTAGSQNERSRKVLDAIGAYASIAPKDLVSSVGERLLQLVAQSHGGMQAADGAVGKARDAHRAAEAAAAKGAAGQPTSTTGAALGAAIKAAAATASRMCSLLALALALLPSLPPGADTPPPSAPEPLLTRFYASLRPLVESDAHPAVQKRAYAALASLLGASASHASHALSTPERRDELLTFLAGAAGAASASARRGRLVCLCSLVGSLDIAVPSQVSLLPSLLGEVMAATKDPNSRVRAAGFSLLSTMGAVMASGGDGGGAEEWEQELEAGGAAAAAAAMDEEEEEEGGPDDEGDDDVSVVEGDDRGPRGGAQAQKNRRRAGKQRRAAADAAAAPLADLPLTRVTTTEFFRMLVAGLGAGSPHMRSAAVQCLARALYEHAASPAVQSLLGALLGTVLQLMKESSREVVKSAVGFIKVSASCMPPATLAALVPSIVPALLLWSGETKNRLRAKIKGVLERLVRKVGFDAVAEHVPAADAPLMAAMRKKRARLERRREANASAAAAAGGGGEEEEGAGEEEDDLFGGAGSGGEDDGEDAEDAKSRATARSWGVVGSRAPLGGPPASRGPAAPSVVGGAGTGGPKPSRMTAITAGMRAGSAMLRGAALPPPGAILGDAASFVDKRQSVAMGGRTHGAEGDRATVLTRRTGHPAAAGAGAQSSGGRSAGAKRAPSALLRGDDDAPLDLLDPTSMRRAVGGTGTTSARMQSLDAARARAARADAAPGGSSGGFKVDPQGRLIIPDDTEEEGEGGAGPKGKKRKLAHGGQAEEAGGEEAEAEDEDNADIRARARPGLAAQGGRRPSSASAHGGADDLESGVTGGSAMRRKRPSDRGGGSTVVGGSTGPQGWGMMKKRDGGGSSGKSAVSSSGGGPRYSGAQYAGGAGTGDSKRVGAKFEPFAYVPLDARSMSGKHGAKAVGRFAGVTKSTSKGQRSALKREAGAEGHKPSRPSHGHGRSGAGHGSKRKR